jgi:hypothetical protein
MTYPLWEELKPLQTLAAAQFFKHKRLLLALPRQEGKTELGVRLLRDVTARDFTSSSLFLAKDRKAGKKATREKFMRLFPSKEFCVNTEQVYLKKHPTSAIFMDSVDKDPERLRGGTYSLIHWSEIAFSKLELGCTIIDIVEKILKWTQRKTSGYFLGESTMNGSNGWKDLWEAAADFGFARLKVSYSQMLEMGLVTQAEYDAEKKNTHPLVFAQELECEFVTFRGRAYDEFAERHIWPDMPGPADWQMVISAIDWGWKPSATCVLLGYVHRGMLCVFDEIYEMEQLPKATAEAIEWRKAMWMIERLSIAADHEPDRNEELTLRGIPASLAKKSNVLGNRLEIKELLYFDKIRIHPRCKFLIKDLNAATWNPKKEGDLDDSQCTWGHFDAEAALRYLVRELSKAETIEPVTNPHVALGDPVSLRAWDLQKQGTTRDEFNPW